MVSDLEANIKGLFLFCKTQSLKNRLIFFFDHFGQSRHSLLWQALIDFQLRNWLSMVPRIRIPSKVRHLIGVVQIETVQLNLNSIPANLNELLKPRWLRAQIALHA